MSNTFTRRFGVAVATAALAALAVAGCHVGPDSDPISEGAETSVSGSAEPSQSGAPSGARSFMYIGDVAASHLLEAGWTKGGLVTGKKAVEPLVRVVGADKVAASGAGFAGTQGGLQTWSHPEVPGATVYTDSSTKVVLVKVAVGGDKAAYVRPSHISDMTSFRGVISDVEERLAGLSRGEPVVIEQTYGQANGLVGFSG